MNDEALDEFVASIYWNTFKFVSPITVTPSFLDGKEAQPGTVSAKPKASPFFHRELPDDIDLEKAKE